MSRPDVSDSFASPNILIDPKSAEATERRKWEAQYTPFGPGMRPYQHKDYPMMLHLAGRPAGGMGAAAIVETQEVGSPMEANPYISRGFRQTPLEALEMWECQQLEFANLAANRNWQSVHGRISEKAQVEVARAEARSVDHLPDVPVTPIKRRRRTKAEMEASQVVAVPDAAGEE